MEIGMNYVSGGGLFAYVQIVSTVLSLRSIALLIVIAIWDGGPADSKND